MNKVILEGRIVRDITAKETGNTTVAHFTVACSRPKQKDSEDKADFISCVAFGKQAEFLGKYFGKGKPILLEGRIQTGSYEDKDGKKIYTTDVITERVDFVLADKSERGAAAAPATSTEEGFSELDDVPF